MENMIVRNIAKFRIVYFRRTQKTAVQVLCTVTDGYKIEWEEWRYLAKDNLTGEISTCFGHNDACAVDSLEEAEQFIEWFCEEEKVEPEILYSLEKGVNVEKITLRC